MHRTPPNTAQIIYSLRKQKNLTQQELADMLGISRTSYSNYETGRRKPEIELLIRLSAFYEINIIVMLFTLCMDEAETNNIMPSDIIRSFSCGIFFDTKIFNSLNGYLALPENYKNDILTFVECAISLNSHF